MISDLNFILLACAFAFAFGMLVVWLPARRERKRLEADSWRAARNFYRHLNNSDLDG